MSTELMTVLEEARKLPPQEKQELADLLIKDLEQAHGTEQEIARALAIVEETSGSMTGLDRETLVRLAEDEGRQNQH